MRTIAAAALAPLLGLVLAACAADAPIPTTPLPGLPCGTTWHPCGGGTCCPNGTACGADHTPCPAGSCCYLGTSGLWRARRSK